MIPRVELHCHLDGSMRVETIVELAASEGRVYDRPIAELATTPGTCDSLVDFLTAIDVQLDVLQIPTSIERAAFELVEDFAADGVAHGEIRFAPHLHQRRGHSIEEVIEATYHGAQRAAEQLGISAVLIACALRHRDPAEGLELIAANRRLDRLIAGVDLAGPEAGFSCLRFKDFFNEASADGLGVTIHAGEAAGPVSVWEAIDLGASRIGHGVRSIQDPNLVIELAKRQITLECCPRCNVLTKAVPTIEAHPIDLLHQAGVPTTVSTDTRTCIPTSLDEELQTLQDVFGWDQNRIVASQLAAANASFADSTRRAELKRMILAAQR